MAAHNHVMKKFGYTEKLEDIKSLAGKGAWVMMQRSFKEKINDEKIKNEMTKEFINFYSKNIDRESKPLDGCINFLEWAKKKKYFISCVYKQTRKFSNRFIKKIRYV